MENVNNQKTLVVKMLWMSLLLSHLIFGYIGPNFLARELTETLDQNVVLGALGFFALVNAAMAIWFNLRCYKEELWREEKSEAMGRFITMNVVSWALSETITIFGAVSLVIGLDSTVFYSFLAIGIGLHLYHRPQLGRLSQLMS
ncbi:MAG: hypothetical protein HN509_04355 [Halobacteriovoraceae bacterium]|jgi:hypothetical protein|nr:hypothetical protein [Halobacteriovoraceae bacterium]MBT5094849.1 hypothetical protein [Halobacteriovoraceae bacterium]